jgi:hypothetical protein
MDVCVPAGGTGTNGRTVRITGESNQIKSGVSLTGSAFAHEYHENHERFADPSCGSLLGIAGGRVLRGEMRADLRC